MSQIVSCINIFKSKQVEHFIIDGEPWFKAVQVAEILEYKDTDQAIRNHVEDKYKKILTPSNQRGQGYYIISEPGLYELIFKSRKKEAKDFKSWVLEEVLPSIRKNCKYKYVIKINQLEEENKRLTQRLVKLTIQKEFGVPSGINASDELDREDWGDGVAGFR